jgi:hypothetical protein
MSLYRCENEFGADPCIFARENRKIPVDEVAPSMDGTAPKCPGKTLSGKPCGCELISLPPPPPRPWKKILIAVVGILVVVVLIWFFTRGAEPSNGSENSSETTPVIVTQDTEQADPWWIYQQLETSSKILRTEP